MTSQYIGEIRIVPYNFVPSGWAMCDGQVLPLAQNEALYAIIGTTYGGNGVDNFGLPDLRGRIPLHVGTGLVLGQSGGEEGHVLTVPEMPLHTHQAMAQTVATNPGGTPTNAVWATSNSTMFGTTPNTAMSAAAIGGTGSNQAHPNEAPYLALTFAIALQGIFPTR